MRPVRTRLAAERGFSAVELLLCGSVAAVCAAAALPSLQQMQLQSQARADVFEFTEAVRLARSEALKRSTEVSLCAAAAEQPGEAPRCRTDASDWSAGWLVFLDGAERGQVDTGDLLIRAYQRAPTAGPVLGGPRSITFQATGLSSWGNGRIRFMPPTRGTPAATAEPLQVVCLNKPGRARVAAGSTCSS